MSLTHCVSVSFSDSNALESCDVVLTFVNGVRLVDGVFSDRQLSSTVFELSF